MASFSSNRVCACALLGVLVSFAASGCVEPFSGSNVQFTLSGAHIPGTPSDFGRPPPGTHYEFHAFELITDTDMDGNEVVVQTFTHKIANFEVRPMVDTSSPCFIEVHNTPFPGLHSTQVARKLREVYGIDDPYNPPAGADAGEIIDILTADRRMDGQGLIETGIKAITTHDPSEYPSDIPAIDRIDEASNDLRRQKCRAFWADHPLKYEGSDQVFTLPHNSPWIGAVDGADPRNSVFIGGAKIEVEAGLIGIDGMLMNWQYDCTPADLLAEGLDCTPDYPDTLADDQKSDLGVHYMAGNAVAKTRGVINVPLESRTFSQLSGEIAIFANLDNDQVHF